MEYAVEPRALHECRLNQEGGLELAPETNCTTTCTGVRAALLSQNRTLVIACLRNTVEEVERLLASPRASHIKYVRYRLQSGHCALCDEKWGGSPWPLKVLSNPRAVAFTLLLPLERKLSKIELWPHLEIVDYGGFPSESSVDRVLGRDLRSDVDNAFELNCPMLEKLSLRRCVLSVPALKCPDLWYLDVSHCKQLSDEGVGRICRDLTHLTVLKMRMCSRVRCPEPFGAPSLRQLDATGCTCLVDLAVTSLSQTSPRLAGLALSECPALIRPRIELRELTELNLSFCRRLVDESIQEILKYCPSLRELRCNFSTKITEPLKEPSLMLKSLSLRGTRLTPDTLKVVLESPRLHFCDLRDCPMLDHLPPPLPHCRCDIRGSPAAQVPAAEGGVAPVVVLVEGEGPLLPSPEHSDAETVETGPTGEVMSPSTTPLVQATVQSAVQAAVRAASVL